MLGLLDDLTLGVEPSFFRTVEEELLLFVEEEEEDDDVDGFVVKLPVEPELDGAVLEALELPLEPVSLPVLEPLELLELELPVLPFDVKLPVPLVVLGCLVVSDLPACVCCVALPDVPYP